ncbi:MAG: aminoacyl-histidine dipeptidase [Cardiobacteriaceae bacterium]|nr:aminoacyl-histidine dipeptidase [Cardiobacteriaceae bacterium]
MQITDLEPKALWHYFHALTQIPRPSHHEEAVQAYILETAKALGLEAKRDEVGNIVVRKAASKGKEQQAGVILQAHLDMVPQKNNDKIHDFTKDPIKTVIKGDWVYADGTTLGADNGLGVAAMLAVLADNTLEHPPLEALFTATEEVGMDGAKGLKGGFLQGKYLINLDYEEEGELCIGCAGGLDASFAVPYGIQYQTLPTFRLEVKGLKGGHSGVDIHKGRGNALKILAESLVKLKMSQLLLIEGGNLRNAIPREATASFSSNLTLAEQQSALARLESELKRVLPPEEQGLKLSVYQETSDEQAWLSVEDSQRCLNFIRALPNGVDRMSAQMEDLVETSTNLAAVTFAGSEMQAHCLLRSSDNQRRNDLASRMESVVKLAGGRVEFSGDYNGWQPMPESDLVRVMAQTGKDIYGTQPPLKAIHAGLECGILSTHYPHWEMVAFGPTIESPHSPDERAHIESTKRFYFWLTKALSQL